MFNRTCMMLAAVAACGAMSQTASAVDVKLEQVAEGLTHPLTMVSPPGDDRRFIVEQLGTIRILTADGKLLDEPFLNIREKMKPLLQDFDEEGLLGLAFHPDFKKNGKFYIAYTARIPGIATLDKHLWWAHTNTVSEFQVSKDNPNKANRLNERKITEINWPQFNHNGHWIGFGPDGYLYISSGDGGYANDWGIGHTPATGNGQDMSEWHGKILRIDVNNGDPYSVPKDNPFVGKKDVVPEIWASGLRNPWRCSFDMGGTHELFCADVGQNSFEEVNIITKGGNYGWRVKEGTHCFDFLNPNKHPASCNDAGMTDPIIEYNNCNVTQDCKGLSITGGYVYRGPVTAWQGKYFFGDWSRTFAKKDGRLFVASRSGSKWSMEDVKVVNMPDFDAYVLGFGQDGQGNVYVMASVTTGPVGAQDKIYKIVAP